MKCITEGKNKKQAFPNFPLKRGISPAMVLGKMKVTAYIGNYGKKEYTISEKDGKKLFKDLPENFVS